ncbi:MAG: hypothetical protein NC094_09425 [Bacteroidales bacterium]|nr:hypothetical protein [Lachnoclostridium sp.]MCM1384916.1 hypothetical protein [Lachnoclostridium sp.]MCM1465626.1 hypothetical protein [Bacteroidales bacterium]
MSKKKVRIIAGVMLIFAIGFFVYALTHPTASFPWSNVVTYFIYALYLLLMMALFIAPDKLINKTSAILTVEMIAGVMMVGIIFVISDALKFSKAPSSSKEEQQTLQYAGQIFLYGEEHSSENILEKEFELWQAYYDEGMRDLFVELPYYTAEYMNLWMQSENDDILNSLYKDWEGTAVHSDIVLDFYKRIKRECPETIFHGTDVGHQYGTTGKRFLKYLESNGQKDSELYKLAQENINQGKYYYRHSDNVYRENKMVENFVREVEKLNSVDVMGIYGSAHTGLEAMDYATNTIPCMANQLHEKYGDAIYAEDLTLSTRNTDAYRTDTIVVNGKEYTALYYGEVDLSALLPDYKCREFWLLENAYDDFKDNPTTGNVLPYNNYPMKIEVGQIYVIEYTKADGSVMREYHRADGNMWQGLEVTEEITVED